MSTNGNGFPPEAALRMHRSIEDSLERGGLGSTTFYFAADGRRLLPQYERDDGKGGTRPAGPPKNPAFVIDHPFRPSVASLTDMIREHAVTGEVVLYCEERWEADPRVDEQAGPSLVEDWMLVELIEKRVAV